MHICTDRPKRMFMHAIHDVLHAVRCLTISYKRTEILSSKVFRIICAVDRKLNINCMFKSDKFEI